VDARWPSGHRYRARKPGVEWAALDGPAPQATAPARLRQMKDLFRRFSATARDDVLKTSDELRPLAHPLHEYTSPAHGVVQGVLCGFAANGGCEQVEDGRGRPLSDLAHAPAPAGSGLRTTNSIWSPTASTSTVSPSPSSPDSTFRASGFSTSRWIVRFSGRAPNAGS